MNVILEYETGNIEKFGNVKAIYGDNKLQSIKESKNCTNCKFTSKTAEDFPCCECKNNFLDYFEREDYD